eukprot:32744-Eustigmatos_ZCMA.PRE.1
MYARLGDGMKRGGGGGVQICLDGMEPDEQLDVIRCGALCEISVMYATILCSITRFCAFLVNLYPWTSGVGTRTDWSLELDQSTSPVFTMYLTLYCCCYD